MEEDFPSKVFTILNNCAQRCSLPPRKKKLCNIFREEEKMTHKNLKNAPPRKAHQEKMAALQKELLRRYSELMGAPSLKEIAEDTGIQVTRVFRLFNGHEMRMAEYFIFKQRVDELGIEKVEWREASRGLSEYFSGEGQLLRLKLQLKRKMAYQRYFKRNDA